jgi:di/tricarboxylate transporter
METGILLVTGLLVLAVVLFVTERLPPAGTAVLILALLLALGEAGIRGGWLDAGKWITPAEAFSGFSNPAVVAVAGMFVLSAALERQGLVAGAAILLGRIGRHPTGLLAGIMLLTAAVSAFANNTAAVAALLPAVMVLCAQRGLPPSRFLIPLSFAAQFGGVCTLVGTSTNLLVNDIAVRAGRPEFGFFEFAPLGLAMTAAGTLYFLVAGRWLLPDRKARLAGGAEEWEPGEFVSEVRILPDSPAIGHTVADAGFVSNGAPLQVLELIREGVHRLPAGLVLRSGDVLLVRAMNWKRTIW